MTKEEILERFIKTHDDKYDYSRAVIDGLRNKVDIVCRVHGVFSQAPYKHIIGQGCPLCGRESSAKKRSKTTEQFKEEATLKHNGKYDYSKVEYVNEITEVTIMCPVHGEFRQLPSVHLGGHGCPKCGIEERVAKERRTTSEFIEKATKVHDGKYDYSKVDYVDERKKVTIICPVHGEFEQIPINHLNGEGCYQCGFERQIKKRTRSTKEFIDEATKVHEGKYDYSLVDYKGNKRKVKIICPVHGVFEQRPNDHLNHHGCPDCALEQRYSRGEKEVLSFVESISDLMTIVHDREAMENGKELDMLILPLNIAIEYNGVRFHSVKFKPWDYHMCKTNDCLAKGIMLIHIFEDEWMYKRAIVESMLYALFNKSPFVVNAADCTVKAVGKDIAISFLNENHIMGECDFTHSYGLYDTEDNLVSLMAFMREGNTDNYELVRLCNKLRTNVIGGAEMLFRFFKETIKINEITTYVDRRWSNGKMFENMGFYLSHIAEPDYTYVDRDIRRAKDFFSKEKLIAEDCDYNKDLDNILAEKGIYRIYDCGSLVYKYTV